MRDVNQDHVNALLEQVRTSYAQRDFQRTKLHKLLFWVCILLTILFISSLGTIYYLAMLKEKEVKAALVIMDGKDGIVQQVQYLEPGKKITNNEALIKGYAYDYVVSRYGYYWVGSTDTLRMRYQRVLAFTDAALKTNVANEISSRNPDSPYNILGEKGAIEIDNVTTNLFAGNRIQISFRSTVKKGDGTNKVYSYTALGTYDWNRTEGLSVDDRHINPLGFVFTEWNITQNSSNDLLNTQPTQPSQPVASPETQPNVSTPQSAQTDSKEQK